DLDDVTLPVVQVGRVLDQEEQQVFLGLLWYALWLLWLGCSSLGSRQQVVVGALRRFALSALLGLGQVPKPLVRIDVLLDREHGIQKLLDLSSPVLEFVAADPIGASRRALDHRAVRTVEVDV